MAQAAESDHAQRVLDCWWLLELFSPQKVPKLTKRAHRPPERQVVEWHPGQALPWQELSPPPRQGKTERVWRHTVYLGVYALSDTYHVLGQVFGEDPEAHDQRPDGLSACAGLLVGNDGVLIDEACLLSSAAWGIGQLQDATGAARLPPLMGFSARQDEFVRLIDEMEGHRRHLAKADRALPQDADSVLQQLGLAHTLTDVEGLNIGTDRIIIESLVTALRPNDESVESDFLNSLYLSDLSLVRQAVASGDIGAALASYLMSDSHLERGLRQDVIRSPALIDLGVSAPRLPLGRWLSNPEHALARSQQFSVNHALTDLSAGSGLMGVNGPPGTGKTTMLRDVLAGNVVQRAQRLAQLSTPAQAFTSTIHRWRTTDDYPREVPQLRPDLVGFEMVVASANNAAVENVSLEVPSRQAIAKPWSERADYFGELASRVIATSSVNMTSEENGAVGGRAWGLISARLGNKRNRASFYSTFWFDQHLDPKDPPLPGMQSLLREWDDGERPRKPWAQARHDFNVARDRVTALIRLRMDAEHRGALLPVEDRDLHGARGWLIQCNEQLNACRREHEAHRPQVQIADLALQQARDRHKRHQDAQPSWWEALISCGKATTQWRASLEPLDVALAAAEADHLRKHQQAQDLRVAVEEAVHRARKAESAVQARTARVQQLGEQVAADRERYGQAYPDALGGDEREKRAPWLDAELDAARSDLFLAALELHRDFLANCAGPMRKGLRGALEVMASLAPASVPAGARLASWQLLFLVVPLISTTFASAGRMFNGLGAESLGWLFIDEAGQACPQYAAGAMWRAKRVIAVGDPLQLQPVVTMPTKAQAAIAQYCRVAPLWLPPRASAQTLSDRVARFGTELAQGDEPVWVSAPLRVHRRCDDPMFTLCNSIAYNGIMVNGVHRKEFDPERPDLFQQDDGRFIAPSHWADEAATQPGTHLQPTQIERCTRALEYLSSKGVDYTDIIAISPFRDVADRLASMRSQYPGLNAGTIHTAQGREAPVVILVLGGAPDRPGAKSWAASKVNLVNVAASRAQRRLYVIGDRAAWSEHNYFRQLSATLA